MTEIEYLKQENKKLVKALDDYGNKNFKYKQALEEIREIAEQWLKNDWSCYYCRRNMDEKLKEIIKLTRF